MTESPSTPGAPPVRGQDIDAALAWAWQAFRRNTGPFVLSASLVLVLGIVLYAGAAAQMFFVADALGLDSPDAGFFPGFPVIYATTTASLVPFFFLMHLALANLVSMSLTLADGGSVGARDALRFRHLGRVAGTAAIVSVASGLGYLLCWLPGPVVLLASAFSLFFVLDDGLRPLESIRASVRLFRSAPGASFVAVLLCGFLATFGAVACGVGVLVSVPLATLVLTHRFRTLSGGAVAEPVR